MCAVQRLLTFPADGGTLQTVPCLLAHLASPLLHAVRVCMSTLHLLSHRLGCRRVTPQYFVWLSYDYRTTILCWSYTTVIAVLHWLSIASILSFGFCVDAGRTIFHQASSKAMHQHGAAVGVGAQHRKLCRWCVRSIWGSSGSCRRMLSLLCSWKPKPLNSL
jgi:hypothetical protein